MYAPVRSSTPLRCALYLAGIGGLASWSAGGRADDYTVTFIPDLHPIRILNDGRVLGTRSLEGGQAQAVLWSEIGEVTIDPPSPGMEVVPADANEAGVVVGRYDGMHAFRWHNGNFEILHPPAYPSSWSWATSINSRGDAVGSAQVLRPNGAVLQWSVLWRARTAQDPPGTIIPATQLGWLPEGANNSIPNGINGSDEIVGYANIGQFGSTQACVWLAGQVYAMDWGNAVGSHAWCNSNTSFVGGEAALPVGQQYPWHAVIWDDPYSSMRVVGGPYSRINGINGLGEAVGEARLPDPFVRAALWRNGQEIAIENLVTLPPGTHLRWASDINDNGEIICFGQDDDTLSGTFVVRPLDTDKDGLLDAWESQGGGIDINGDGVIELDLYARGARPNHKDLFVEVDAMTGFMPAFETLLGGPNRVGIVQAFANAPVSNPDGATGILLHVQMDEATIPPAAWPADWWAEFDAVKAQHFGTFAERNNPNAALILTAKKLVFRYCIFAHSYSDQGSSGVAELPGNDFMVTLGTFPTPGGTPEEQAGAFMHEFGHTLGLLHGGGDSINYKPNFYSVMNYAWTFPAHYSQPWWRLDYSREQLNTLDEAALYEGDGLGGPAGSSVRVPYGAAAAPNQLPVVYTVPLGAMQWADWNRNRALNLSPYAQDLNGWGWGESPSEVLAGWCDWDHILYGVRGGQNFLDGVHARDTADDELTAAEVAALQAIPLRSDGDMNCDGVLNNFDIDPFVLALVDPDAYGAQYPGCAALNADVNADGVVNNFDIDVFVDCLVQGC